MKITRILHPEVVQGLRGNDDRIKKYNLWFSRMGKTEEGFGCSAETDSDRQFFHSHFNHLAISYRARHGIRTYHIGSEFLDAIKKIKTEIPVDLTPEKFNAYIAFPEKAVFDRDGDEIEGCYVYLGDANQTTLPPSEYGSKVLWMVYIIKGGDENLLPKNGFFLKDLSEFKTLNQISDSSRYLRPKGETYDVSNDREPFWAVMFNLILYIHSPESELLPLKPRASMSSKEFDRQSKETGVTNLCSIPVTLISWNYLQPKMHSKESSWVDSFLRWQRCGPQNQQVKLIWVQPHERKYANVAPKTSDSEG